MSTRVALPMFLGCRMSELRRHLVPSPTPNEDRSAQAQVRRNLFGPIDHDENLKFVQNELTKISQADMKRWNFDFEAEKPHEGRYNWEPVVEGVPSAYEMKRLNYLSSNCGGTTTTTPLTTTTTTTSTSSVSSTSSIAPSVPECSTTATTAPTLTKTSASASSTSDKPTFRTSKLNQPSCSKDTKSCSEIVVKQCRPNNNTRSDLKLDSKTDSREKGLSAVKNITTRSSQPQLTTYMKIRKTKRAANTKLEDDQPPALVKRPKTSTS